jgi:mRNA interferase MazF
VVTLSTKGRLDIATHVQVSPSAENGLAETSFVKCEQIMTVSKERLQQRIGALSNAHMATVDAAIKRALSLL